MPTPCEVLDALIQARDLISDESRWTTKEFARDRDGQYVDPLSHRATRFCALGAAMRVTSVRLPLVDVISLVAPLYADVRDALYRAVPKSGRQPSLTGVNDYQGHEAVLRVYDIAIATLKEQCIPAPVFEKAEQKELTYAIAV